MPRNLPPCEASEEALHWEGLAAQGLLLGRSCGSLESFEITGRLLEPPGHPLEDLWVGGLLVGDSVLTVGWVAVGGELNAL